MKTSKKHTMYMVEHQWNITHNNNTHVVNNGVLRSYIDDYPSVDELQTVHNKFAKKLVKFGYDKQYTVLLNTYVRVQRQCVVERFNPFRGVEKHNLALFSHEYDNHTVVSELLPYRVAYLFDHDAQQRVYTDVVFALNIDDAKPKYGYGSIVSIVQLADMHVSN
jgi:F0F1-type ATP synthase gamma subunit